MGPRMNVLDGSPGAAVRGARNPLSRSGLALAGANTASKGGTLPVDAGSGVLTADDVLGMFLSALNSWCCPRAKADWVKADPSKA
jgi:hypothetical protein